MVHSRRILAPIGVSTEPGDFQATTAPSEKTLYALGEPVTVPALTRAHNDVAGQRLQRIYYSDGEKRYVDERMYDTENDTECQVNVLADGTIVCVPLGFIRVGLVYFGAEHCEPPTLPRFLINPGVATSRCAANYEVRERGAPSSSSTDWRELFAIASPDAPLSYVVSPRIQVVRGRR